MALRILLADDSMTAQNMGKKILTEAGFDVVTVSNGAAAVKKLAEAAPDVAILDVYMPGYTGIEVCERMKSAPATAQVPVLLSVGKMEPFRPEEGMKAKADGVIIKPFEATDLVTVVQKLAERAYGANAGAAATESAVEADGEEPDAPPTVEDDPAEEERSRSEAGLQTFAPATAAAAVIAAEPNIEFTSAAKVSVVSQESLPELEPTALQAAPASEQPAEELVMHDSDAPAAMGDNELDAFVAAALANGQLDDFAAVEDVEVQDVQENADLAEQELEPAPLVEPEPETAGTASENVVENAPADQPPASWTAVEADLGADLSIDLEAEMEAASQEQSGFEAIAGSARAQVGAPFLAPLGKTSFDELDAVMEQSAAQMDSSSAAPLSAETADVPVVEDSREDLAINLVDLETPAVEAEPMPLPVESAPGPLSVPPVAVAEQPADAAVAIADEAVIDIADFEMAELQLPEPAAIEAPAIEAQELASPAAISDESVLETDAPMDDAAVSALQFYGLGDEDGSSVLNPSDDTDEPLFALDDIVVGTPEVVDNAVVDNVVVDNVVVDNVVVDNTQPVGDEAAVSVDLLEPVVEATPVPDPLEPAQPEATEMIAMVEEQQTAAEVEAVVPAPQIETASTPEVDDTTVSVIAERVVDRVVDRLKPMLAVMVQEILREFKK